MKFKPGKGYDIKKTLKKFWEGLGYTVILAVLAAVVKYLSGLEGLSPEEAIYIGLIIAILSAIHNAMKHYKDKE